MRDPRRRGAFRAILLLAPLLPGCAPGTSEAPDPGSERRRPNVLLIVVDTLRADHLGCYGAARNTSPAIDALASEAVRFERAYTTAPWTSPAVASLLTGLYPSAHGVTALDTTLSAEVETLAEILAGRGYRTAGVVSHVLVSSERGFAQGFDDYSEDEARGHDHVSTSGVTRRARVRLAEIVIDGDEPFFLFVHYFDPHFRYMPHDRIEFAPERAGRLSGGETIEELRALRDTFSEEEVGFLRDLYDEEIRFTDRGIGMLLEALRTHRLERDTIVVLTADHGEEFLERGWLGHSRTLYEELIRVPLIARVPSVEPKVVSRPVSLVSIAPTILEWIGEEPETDRFQGRSLAELARRGDEAGPPGPVFAEQLARRAVVGERFKLIREGLDAGIELYDLAGDPAERRNLAPGRTELRKELLAQIEAHERASRGRAVEPRGFEVTEPEAARLRELGYAVDGS